MEMGMDVALGNSPLSLSRLGVHDCHLLFTIIAMRAQQPVN